jgi:hypothetical protein
MRTVDLYQQLTDRRSALDRGQPEPLISRKAVLSAPADAAIKPLLLMVLAEMNPWTWLCPFATT